MLWLTTVFWLAGCGGGGSPDAPSNDSPEKSQVNTAPVFTSGNSVSVPENSTVVTRVSASDPEGDPVTYSLAGGIDADLFDMDTQSGELRFKQPADFEAPADSNRNNVYAVAVAASDGVKTAWQALDVSVTGVGLTVEVKPGFIKTLSFRWEPFNGAVYYKLFVNPDGESGYAQVGEDIAATHANVSIPIHLTDWINNRYLVEGFNDEGRVFRSDPKEVRSLMLEGIGYIKALNTGAGAGDLFGISVALSDDGQTLVVGASGESSAATGVDSKQEDNTAFGAGAVYVYSRSEAVLTQQAYIKASNTDIGDSFGDSVALSGDGQTLVVGAPYEDSAATGVDGVQADNTAYDAGAVYVFTRAGSEWTQQAYIKASNTDAGDSFGVGVALSDDGQTLVVGAPREDSAATGVDGEQGDNTAEEAGVVYVFTRAGSEWTQQAYIKASNTDAGDFFGASVALSDDGQTLVVGAPREDSAVTGVDGEQGDNAAEEAGAVYVFTRAGAVWAQLAYIKASNTDAGDYFGASLVLSADGQTLVVGSPWEDSAVSAVDGAQYDNTAYGAGAVYAFTRAQSEWTQQAYIKASNTGAGDLFGESMALSADGQTLVVGAPIEGSAATGVDGEQSDNSAERAGAVYVYTRVRSVWTHQAYIKSSKTEEGDLFGASVALSADKQNLLVGAPEGLHNASTRNAGAVNLL